ncbi:hypothetical protein [Streptomyces sp. NPDC008001]|uniref:hypothetical protein n=1 Tax=Streptomyces sp. NPDC008001 TaxID=3364804 RepID=UPI0036E78ABF
MTSETKADTRPDTNAPTPCTHCTRLNDERHEAELRGDKSAAVDALVLLRRHWRATHHAPGGEAAQGG